MDDQGSVSATETTQVTRVLEHDIYAHAQPDAQSNGTHPPTRRPLPKEAPRYAEGGAVDFRDHPCCAPFQIAGDARTGKLVDPLGRKKLALVGFSSTTRDEAPYDDPTWAIAGLNQLNRYIPRADLWFENHYRDLFVQDIVRGTDYVGWLRQCPLPILMEPDDFDAGRFRDIPMAVRFPIEAANALTGGLWRPQPDGRSIHEPLDYWESTVAYMVQWAVLSGFEELGVWGVDMIAGEEYGYQKPNLEFYLGFAMGCGIKVTVPAKSALLKQMPYRYGRRAPEAGPFSEEFFRAIHNNAVVKREEILTDLNNVDGAITVIRNLREAALIYARGGEIKDFGLVKNHVPKPGGGDAS